MELNLLEMSHIAYDVEHNPTKQV